MTLGYKEAFPDGTPTFFKEKILAGIIESGGDIKVLPHVPKLHSMREDIHDRWYPNMMIHHVYGNRTKRRQCFLKNKCTSTQRVLILHKSKTTEDLGDRVITGTRKLVLVDGRIVEGEKL